MNKTMFEKLENEGFVMLKASGAQILKAFEQYKNTELGKRMYGEGFENLKKNNNAVYEALELMLQTKDETEKEVIREMNQEKETRKRTTPVSDAEKLVTSFMATTFYKQMGDKKPYVDGHMRIYPSADTTEKTNIHWTETDMYVEVGDKKIAFYVDGFCHKGKPKDDVKRSSVLREMGYDVVRLREDDLPRLRGNNGFSNIRVVSSIRTQAGKKEACLKTLDFFRKNYDEFKDLTFDNEIFQECVENTNAVYNNLFCGDDFYESIPENKKEKLQELETLIHRNDYTAAQKTAILRAYKKEYALSNTAVAAFMARF